LKYKYNGTAYKQGTDPNAAWIISFVARAEELLDWVGIPRRSERGLVGFQRIDDPVRVERAKQFFMEPLNQSPTALIVGIHNPGINSQRNVALTFLDQEGDIRRCELIVDFSADQISDGELRDMISSQIKSRLATESSPNLEGDEDELDLEEDDASDDDDEIEQTSGGGRGGNIELGRSLLNELLDKMNDPIWFDENRSAILDFAKPATLIDGQHRVKGAEGTERGIPFTVCALFDCSWSEQVFQFTIVNYTQNGIPDQFITANAALSLTKSELKGLEGRLRQAQVKVIEYDLMKIVNFDDRSPFFQLVDLSDKVSKERIGYKTMVKIAKQWWSGKPHGVAKLIQALYPEVTGKKSDVRTQQLARWQSEDWGDFFIAFWSTVKSKYGNLPSHVHGHKLWDVGYSNLMVAVVLLQFQTVFLEDLGRRDKHFFEKKSKDELIENVAERSRDDFLSWFPQDLFAREWKIKSLNTGAGKAVLLDCFNEMERKQGKFGYANSALVTGKTSATS
jgi:hypothetical protein